LSFTQLIFLTKNYECISLKTKGFSLETEAFCLIGGGENRTLVLSKLHYNDYMLIAFNKNDLDERRPTNGHFAP